VTFRRMFVMPLLRLAPVLAVAVAVAVAVFVFALVGIATAIVSTRLVGVTGKQRHHGMLQSVSGSVLSGAGRNAYGRYEHEADHGKPHDEKPEQSPHESHATPEGAIRQPH
jgi:hypothetical protein